MQKAFQREGERWKPLCGMYGTCLGVLYESDINVIKEQIQRNPALTVQKMDVKNIN